VDLLTIATQFSNSLKQNPIKADVQDLPEPIKKPQRPSTSLWKGDDVALIDWFLAADNLPSDPFQFRTGITVIDPTKFYESLRVEIALGRKSTRAKTGALQSDLKILRELFSRPTTDFTPILKEPTHEHNPARIST